MLTLDEYQAYALFSKIHDDWEPHDAQTHLIIKLFREDIRHLFLQWGRKTGKTEFVTYAIWRWAMSAPNQACYYIAPYAKQAREILWASKRIQKFGPGEFIKYVNRTEMRITFQNNSFIKLDGSDNFTAYDGITPHFVVYDEFRDFRPEFHERMGPNLAVHNAPLIIIGTPPSKENQYTRLAEEFKTHPKKYWSQFATHQNPHISREWLEQERMVLYARGEQDVWAREYLAEFVRGGKRSIFPMFARSSLTPHTDIISYLHSYSKQLEYWVIADPGTVSCFAVLFIALNKYTKTVYLLDELYETGTSNTSTRKVGTKINQKIRELEPNAKWQARRDSAATWFETEFLDNFGSDIYFQGSDKTSIRKEQGLSLIKDLMLSNKLVVSDRCEWFTWEVLNYEVNKNNEIPKENDHLIDCLRYFVNESYLTLTEESAPKKESEREDFRGATIEQDLDSGKFFNETDDIDFGERGLEYL